MGRMKKELDRNGVFQVRLREQYYCNYRSQEKLAEEIGVSRPTIAGWLSGTSIPDILSLKKIAQLFGVSTDYLLGISDTVSPDVSLRAAAEYTGLSSKAVERLHRGIDDFECDGVGINEEEKENNCNTASALINSSSFVKMIVYPKNLAKASYLEKLLNLVADKFCQEDDETENEEFFFASHEDREAVIRNLIHTLKMDALYNGEEDYKELQEKSDDYLASIVYSGILRYRDNSERYQFHAAKAFNAFIDETIAYSHRKAEKKIQE